MRINFCTTIVLAGLMLAGCATDTTKPPTSILGESLKPQRTTSVTDSALNGTWLIVRAELAGRATSMPPEFELKIVDDRYASGLATGPNDRGRIVLFGDELAGQARRMDVVGEVGPNKGRRFPALYRMVNGELEIVYDLSGMNRPTEFVSREGTQLFRVTYKRKS